ncbi:transporter substrate-binding domain-containing protein [Spongorhabdus nitratireducens]
MKKILALCAALLMLAQTSWASDDKSTIDRILERKVLRVGMDVGYMPFELPGKNGPMGFDVDLAKKMAEAMGVELELVNTAWDGIIPALLTDKFDIIMSGMTVTPQRNLQINFADPYITIGQSILLRDGLEDEVTSYRDLNEGKYTIASKLGTTGDFAAKRYLSNAKLRLFETEADAALEVVQGRADAMVYDMPYNAIYASQNGDKVAHLSQPFTYEPLGWGIRKGDADFLNWLNNYLAQIKGDGTYDRIYRKWFESSAWQRNLK